MLGLYARRHTPDLACTRLALQTLVSRELSPREPGDVSVGSFHSSTNHNIISDRAHLQLTVRNTSEETRKILLDGKDLTAQPMHRRARLGVGYLPQEASIFRKLTVEQNILAILENREDLDRAGREKELENLLDELHVGHVRSSLGISLSGGERRRVEIARALAADPLFVLLDEPFAGVDPISVLDIQRIIRHLCERGIGVLITDHNVRETLGICGHAYILSDGVLIAAGPPESILENQHVREVYLGQEFKL